MIYTLGGVKFIGLPNVLPTHMRDIFKIQLAYLKIVHMTDSHILLGSSRCFISEVDFQ